MYGSALRGVYFGVADVGVRRTLPPRVVSLRQALPVGMEDYVVSLRTLLLRHHPMHIGLRNPNNLSNFGIQALHIHQQP